jgi:hypothetical protein
MLKMESLIQNQFEGETPEVWVWSENKKTERSEGYVRRIPFVKWGGYFRAEKHVAVGQQVFVGGKPWMMNDWNGFDLFVAFNAPLGWGTHISQIVPRWDINWSYELQVGGEDYLHAGRLKWPYVLVSFFGHSFYKGWLKHFGVDKIKALLAKLREKYQVVLIGREWDTFMSAQRGAGDVDLVGQTSMGHLLGLCKKAEAFVGFASGAGMLAQHLDCPTTMLWDMQQWHPHFATNWVNPNKLADCTYRALDIKKPNLVDFIAERLLHERDLPADRSPLRDVVPTEALPDRGLQGGEPGPDAVRG